MDKKLRERYGSWGEVAGRVLNRLLPWKEIGPGWVRHGDFTTFKMGGFASANGKVDYTARHNYELLSILEEIGNETFDRSLEIGCGWGRLSPIIASKSESHHGVDINKEAVKIASKYTSGQYLAASASDLPFSDARFDLVVTWTVLQHIPPDYVDQAINEIQRIATQDAKIICLEATRYPEKDNSHTWDRQLKNYDKKFDGFKLSNSRYLTDIDNSVPGIESPGQLMVFRN
jgi:ubiquinone/menaquinone biosynthesis C-methylase UbiE